MHISEGVLSGPVLGVGALLTAGGVSVGIRRMTAFHVPKVALLSSVFFVASLIHVPIGPASSHLVMNGVAGLLLGWGAFPAILVGAGLQAVLFQFGGLTSLGLNTFTMAFPAVIGYYLFSPLVRTQNRPFAFAAGAACGAVVILFSAVLVGTALVFTGKPFLRAAELIVAAHIPVMIIEGILTGFCILFLRRVKPELLHANPRHGAAL